MLQKGSELLEVSAKLRGEKLDLEEKAPEPTVGAAEGVGGGV